MPRQPDCPTAPGCDVHDVEPAARLGRSLTYLLRAIARLRAHAVAEGAQDGGAFPLLAVLSDNGPSRLQAVAGQLFLDPSTTSRHMSSLVERGWVTRAPDPTDGRACLLRLTDDGAAALAGWRARRDRMLAGLVADWPEAEREELVRLLEKLVAELTGRLGHLPDDPTPQPQEMSA